jgi:hypothetical protein
VFYVDYIQIGNMDLILVNKSQQYVPQLKANTTGCEKAKQLVILAFRDFLRFDNLRMQASITMT